MEFRAMALWALALAGCGKMGCRSGPEPMVDPRTPSARSLPATASVPLGSAPREAPQTFSPGRPRNLTAGHRGDDQNPLFSPDGTRIAFTRKRAGGTYEIWIMNRDGTAPRVLTAVADHDSVNMPGAAWCKATDEIVFASDRGRDGDHVWAIKGDGSGARQITSGKGFIDREPVWSPGCDYVAFQSNRDENWEIYVANADGSHPRRMTNHPKDDWEPNWAPEGNKIVFQSKRTDEWSLWLVDAKTEVLTQLTTGEHEDTDASFSPDGRWLVYSTEDGPGHAHIAVLDVARAAASPSRTSPIMLTKGNRYDGAPSWSPDGKQVAFESDDTGNLDVWILDLH